MSNIVIDIAAQFTGKKAFSASEKAVDNLAKTIKRAAIGGGITALLTSSVKAFAADEKAAAMLANTLKNLGLDTFTASVEAMIDKTQLATGVLDEQLRPAFQKLVTSTGDAIQAQELLKLALDVSAGSGNDLVTVASDIANVMAGNNKGLKKYALGLSAVELKTMSATEVQLKFLEVYGGASEKASKTFSGSMLRIKAAAEMARESLGKGLVDGLIIATGSANIDELQKKILDFGKSAGNAFKTLGKVIKENLGLLKSLAITFAAIWTVGKVIAGVEATIKILNALNKTYKLLRATAVGTAIAQMAVLNPIGAIAYGLTLVAGITAATISIDKLGDAFSNTDDKANKLLETTKAIGNFQMSTGTVLDLGAINRSVDAMYLKKAAAAKAKADKAAADAKIKADKLAAANKAKLDKAAAVFDMQKIQIAAALKGKISEEEKIRLLLMQAIEEGNADKAEVLQKKLEAIQAINAKIAADLLAIGEATDPFANWVLSLDAAAAILGKMPALLDATGSLTGRGKVTLPTGDGLPGGSGSSIFTDDMTAADIADAATAAADMAAAAALAAADAVIANESIVLALAEAANGLTDFADVITNVPAATGSSSMFNPYGQTPGSSAGAGIPYPSTNVYVTVEGSILSENDAVTAITNAVIQSQKNGNSLVPRGAVLE